MNPFFLIFIGIPTLEIFLIITVGGKIGALYTVILIFLTAIIGVYFAKIQGIQTLKSGMISVYRNKQPIYEIVSGASIAVAALFLILPGFFTDFVGFILLVPFTRKFLFSLILKNKYKKNEKNHEKIIDGEIIENQKDES